MKLNLRLARLFGIGMFLTILSFTLMQAQQQPWRTIGPWGGNITAIKIKFINDSVLFHGDLNDSIVVASYGSGIFITGDLNETATANTTGNHPVNWAPSAGNPNYTWVPRSDGLPSLKVLSLAIRNIGQSDTMFVGLDGSGIYKTVNAGLTWERAFGLGDAMSTRSVYDIAIHPNTSWVAYAATNQGLYRTTNFGVTWVQVINGGTFTKVQMHEYTTQKIYATSGGNLYRSTNMGVSWTTHSVNGSQITAMALAFSALDTIYVGCDNGNVYEVTFPVPLPNGPGWYPGAYEGVFTVVEKSRGLIPGNSVTDMAIIPSYASQGGGTFTTTGRDSIMGNDTIYMTTRQGVFKSDKKGATWTQVNKGLESTNGSVIAVYPLRTSQGMFPGPYWGGDPAHPYAVLFHDVFVGTTLGGLYHTSTSQSQSGAAVSWTKIDEGIPVAGLRAVSVTPTYSSTVFAGGGYLMGSGLSSGSLYKTIDADAAKPTWQVVYPDDRATNGLYIMDIATDWENKGYVLIADSVLGVIRCISDTLDDAGSPVIPEPSQFTVIPNTASARSVYINRMHSDTMFAGRSNGTNQLLRSFNAFETFDAITLPAPGDRYPIACITMDSASGGRTQNLYVGTLGGAVYKSTDLGNTFRLIDRGVGNRFIYSISVGSGPDSNYVIIGTEYGSYFSTDGGENWSDNDEGLFMDQIQGVYTVRGDTTWGVFLNATTKRNTGIFYQLKGANVGSTWLDTRLNGYGDNAGVIEYTNAAFTTGDIVGFAGAPVKAPNGYFLSTAPLLMRDIDMIWKWDEGNDAAATPAKPAIAGYVASETWAIFARNNTGATIANVIINVPGAGSNLSDSLLVWIPDTLSALRGVHAVNLDFFDIPIMVRNIQRADSLVLVINIPSTYFEEAGVPYNGGTYPLPAGTFYPIITDGTITEGFTVSPHTDPTRLPGANAAPGYISFASSAGDMRIGTGVDTIRVSSRSGKFASNKGDILFKIRVSIAQKTPTYTANDSTPTVTPPVTATELYLLGGGTANAGQGALLDDIGVVGGPNPIFRGSGTAFFARKRDGTFDTTSSLGASDAYQGFSVTPIADAKFAVAGEPGIDSVAVFWFRREPGGGEHDIGNDLPGMRAVTDALTLDFPDATTAASRRGEVGAGYNGSTQTPANFVTDRLWNPIQNTGGDMLIGINTDDITYPYLTYDGFPEKGIRTGDAIGAFYYRNDSLVNGGWAKWVPGSGAAIRIWRDDDKTPLKDGFVEFEKINFKIYDSRYKKVWEVEDVTLRNGDIAEYIGGKTIEITSMRAKNYVTTNIRLKTGWNLISSNIVPRWPEMETIFKRQVVNNSLTIVKDENGLVYWPQIEVNQLPYWNIEEAYWVYMYAIPTTADSILDMQGGTIDLTRNSIPLHTGWNLLPYWGTKGNVAADPDPTAVPISTALAALVAADPQLIVKSVRGATTAETVGLVYWPAIGYDEIKFMYPGEGYELYLNIDYPNFMYPSIVQTNIRSIGNGNTIHGLALEKKATSMYNPIASTPFSQTIAFKVEGYKLKEGDEIGIFTREGVCVGSGKFNNSGSNVIAVSVFGNAPAFEDNTKVGAIEGDELLVKLYSKTNGEEYTPVINDIEWILGSGSGLFFKPGTIASASVKVFGAYEEVSTLPTEFAIAQNYPNPFNPTTNIKYQLPVDGFVKIKIFDMLGREIKTLINQDQKAGYYTIEWDATNNNGRKAASGVYFYQIEASNFKKTMKMMLMK